MYEQLLVRYGDLTLKGKNKRNFIDCLYKNTLQKFKDLKCEVIKTYDRIYINLNGEDLKVVEERLKRVAGLKSYSCVVKCDAIISDIYENALELLKREINKNVTFKVESKRANKNFLYTSIELSKMVAEYVLPRMDGLLKVDVHNPEKVLHVEIKNNSCYLYLNEIKLLGGFPTGIAGKGLVMTSGGIDSPVAAFLTMKQGCEVELIHFESTPLTSIESAQKVIDLTKKLAKYAPKNKIVCHMIPFKNIHEELLKNVPESYNITIMRRMMYRIAHKLALKRNCVVIINGESIGQVASQTLYSMNTINSVTSYPIIRPLATYDKEDIIKISRSIDTYDISIKPFEDCCTVYVPKNPVTKPTILNAIAYENRFDYESLIDEAVLNVKTFVIDENSNLDLPSVALEVKDVL